MHPSRAFVVLAVQLALQTTLPQSMLPQSMLPQSPAAANAPAVRQDSAPPQPHVPRVLLLFEEAMQIPAVAVIEDVVRERLGADSTERVELFEEHLRLMESWDEAANRVTYDYLRRKYAVRRPDLVIAAGLSHAVVEKLTAGAVVGDVPVVLLSSDMAELAASVGSGRVTGVAIRPDAAATIEAALRLQPETRHVLVVVGTTDFERGIEQSMREQLARYDGRMRIEFTSGMRFPDVLRRARSLRQGSVIIFATLLRDSDRGRYVSMQALEQIERVAKVPIYGVAATHLGHGIVGGALIDFPLLGERGAAAAAALLSGARPADIPVDTRIATTYVFDAQVMQRFGLDQARLPSGSRVIDRNAAWREYWWPILLLLVVVAAEAALILALLRQIRQRHAAEQARETSRQLELLLVQLSAKLVAATAAQLDAVAGEILAQTAEFIAVDRAMLALLEDHTNAVGVLQRWTAPGAPPVPPTMGPADMPASWARLQRGEIVQIDSLSSIPDDLAPDRGGYARAGARSVIGIPMMANGRCLGVIGFATLRRERAWEPEIVDGLRVLGLVLTSSINRRHAELELVRRREELSHLARVGLVGELSASLAHEINQPLGAILLSVQAAQRWLAAGTVEPHEVGRLLERASTDVQRTYAIIDRLRRLLRKQPSNLTELHLDDLVAGITVLLSGDAMRRRITLTQAASEDVPPVQGDHVQIEQVVVNLVLNAFDSIVAANATMRHVRVSVDAHQVEGEVVVAVEDSGGGIAPDQLESIFEPFVTSKSNGIGMGLSICRMIVEAHGGRIWAENLPGGGARVAFALAARPAVAPEEPREDGRPSGDQPGFPSRSSRSGVLA